MAANLVILEFDNIDALTGEGVWPPELRTPTTTASTFSTRSTTKLVYVCCDAACRVAVSSPTAPTATAADYPLIVETANPFRMNGGVYQFKFV